MAGCPALMLCHIPDMDIHSAGYLRKIEMPISISDCILDIWQIPGRKLDILTNGYQKASLCITVYYSSLVEHEVVGKLLLVEEHRGGETNRAYEESEPKLGKRGCWRGLPTQSSSQQVCQSCCHCTCWWRWHCRSGGIHLTSPLPEGGPNAQFD